MKHIIIGILTLILVTTLLVGCSSQEKTNQQLPIVEDSDLIVSSSGSIVVSHEAKLAFGSGGKIVKIYVDKGDEVSEGQVLARLDGGPLELALAETLVTLDLAKYNLEKTEEPFSDNNIESARFAVDWGKQQLDYAIYWLKHAEWRLPRAEASLIEAEKALSQAAENEVEKAETALAEAIAVEKKWRIEVEQYRLVTIPDARVSLLDFEARLEAMLDTPTELAVEAAKSQLMAAELAVAEAQKQLNDVVIIAPFDGVVTDVCFEEGHTISVTTLIINLIDLTSMELEVNIDEIDIVDVKVGQRVIIEVDALPVLQLEGEIRSISTLPRFEAGMVLYVVKIGFDIPLDSGLKVDMSAIANIIINE